MTIGALGWGQIQIANSNQITLKPQYSRKKWMLEMCDALLLFYPKEIAKIEGRIGRFEEVKDAWTMKADVWVVPPVELPKSIETSKDETAN